MSVTQGRLLPSIVRVNSESDIEEVENELTKLPVLRNGNVEGAEQQKEKWWMREGRSRFFARPSKGSWRQQKLYKMKTSGKWLPPLQGKSYLQENSKKSIDNSSSVGSTQSTTGIDGNASTTNFFRPWRIRMNSIFIQSTPILGRSTNEPSMDQSEASMIDSKPLIPDQSQSEVFMPSTGTVRLFDLGPLQNNNPNLNQKNSPTRRKRRPARLYNNLSSIKQPNYEFVGFSNSPERFNNFIIINDEVVPVNSQSMDSTTNPEDKVVNEEPVLEVEPSTNDLDGSILGQQHESQVTIDNAIYSSVSVPQIGVNVTLDDYKDVPKQSQCSIKMQINITLPPEINAAAAIKKEIVHQPTKVKGPLPQSQVQVEEVPEMVTMSQLDTKSTNMQALIKESLLMPLPVDDKDTKHKTVVAPVVKHLIPCHVPRHSTIDWDNYPGMMINGTKFGEYMYRGLQASAAAVLSHIIDKRYQQLGAGKAENLAKLLRSLKGDLSNLADHVELIKMLKDPAIQKLLSKGLDKETAKQFQALLAQMFKNDKLPPGMEGDLFQLFNGGLLDNPALADEMLDALQDDPGQEIAFLCSLLNNPDISAEEKEIIKEMLHKKLAGDGSGMPNEKLVATLLEMINNGTIDASMIGDGNLDMNEIIEQLQQGKMSDQLVSAVLQMMENGVLNSSQLIDEDDENGGMMSKILQALREGNSAILGDDEDGITSKILKALKEGKIDMTTALKAILEAKSNKKGGVLDKVMKKINKSRRHRDKRRRRRHHGSGSSSYSDSSYYSSDESGSWSSSGSSTYSDGRRRRHHRRRKHGKHHRQKHRSSGDEYNTGSSSYSSYSSDESEFEFTKSGRHRYAWDRRRHRRHGSGRDGKRRRRHKGALVDEMDIDPNELSKMGDIAAALALCKEVSGEAQMEYYRKLREEALWNGEILDEDDATKWMRLAQERRQVAEQALQEEMAAEQHAKEEAEEARKRYVEEYLGEVHMGIEQQLEERRRLERERAEQEMEDNITRTIREQKLLLEQKYNTEAQRKGYADQIEKLRKERTERRIELQYEHHILNEYEEYVGVWEDQELEYIKYYCSEECVARVMKAHAEKLARRAREREAREKAILGALQDELLATLDMLRARKNLVLLGEAERLELMEKHGRSYFSYFYYVDMNNAGDV